MKKGVFGILTVTVGGLRLSVVAAVRAAGRQAFVASLAARERFSATGIFRSSGCRSRWNLFSWNVDWTFLRDECCLIFWRMLSSRNDRLVRACAIWSLPSPSIFLTFSEFCHSESFDDSFLVKSGTFHRCWSSSSGIVARRNFLWRIIGWKSRDSSDLHWMSIFLCHRSSEAEPV